MQVASRTAKSKEVLVGQVCMMHAMLEGWAPAAASSLSTLHAQNVPSSPNLYIWRLYDLGSVKVTQHQ